MDRYFVLLVIISIIFSLNPSSRAKVLDLNISKLIIDTDAGSDDAAAILMALKGNLVNADLEVIAITCVNGNTALDNVVINVLKTLKTVNRLDIPVYRGANYSFIWTPPSDNFFGLDGFGDFEFPDPPDPNEYLQKEHAVNALIRIVNEKPGEVTVLCLGPLTNVALAIRMDPTFSTKVKQLIIMGGSVKGIGNASPGVEFNFFIDPVADYIVFNSTDTSIEAIQPIVLVPWESVLRNTISTDWRINVLGSLSSPEIELLNKAEKYQLEADYPTWECADCLAGGVLVDPSLVLENGTYYAIAIYDGTITQGSLIVDYTAMENMSPNVVIVKTVDVERYKNLLLSGIGGSS